MKTRLFTRTTNLLLFSTLIFLLPAIGANAQGKMAGKSYAAHTYNCVWAGYRTQDYTLQFFSDSTFEINLFVFDSGDKLRLVNRIFYTGKFSTNQDTIALVYEHANGEMKFKTPAKKTTRVANTQVPKTFPYPASLFVIDNYSIRPVAGVFPVLSLVSNKAVENIKLSFYLWDKQRDTTLDYFATNKRL